jgi:hypothetical protein
MIPLATSQITVNRVEGTAADSFDPYDPYDPTQPAPTVIVTGVRAVIGTPSASEVLAGGDRVVYASELMCDPCDLQAADTVTDTSGTVWTVLWARLVVGFGLDHMQGQLRLVQGAT